MPSLRRHFLPGEEKAEIGRRYSSECVIRVCDQAPVYFWRHARKKTRPVDQWPAERMRRISGFGISSRFLGGFPQ
jgi:hypothetical protein